MPAHVMYRVAFRIQWRYLRYLMISDAFVEKVPSQDPAKR
jgi:hypothetical protein